MCPYWYTKSILPNKIRNTTNIIVIGNTCFFVSLIPQRMMNYNGERHGYMENPPLKFNDMTHVPLQNNISNNKKEMILTRPTLSFVNKQRISCVFHSRQMRNINTTLSCLLRIKLVKYHQTCYLALWSFEKRIKLYNKTIGRVCSFFLYVGGGCFYHLNRTYHNYIFQINTLSLNPRTTKNVDKLSTPTMRQSKTSKYLN